MNKLLWLCAPFMLLFSQSIFAVVANCTTYNSVTFNRVSGTIGSFPYNQTFNDTTSAPSVKNCSNPVAIRSTFKAALGNTDLLGSSPFSVGPTITISGSNANPITLAAAKIWLLNNLQLSFSLQDNNNSPPMVQSITTLNTDYNILPNTGLGSPVIIGGEAYFRGASNLGASNSDVRNPVFNLKLLSTIKPSAATIDALNNSTVRIHLGTISYKYDDYNGSTITPSGNPKTGTTEIYVDIKMTFVLPTCTIVNQIVNLAPVPTATLNSNPTANEQPFNVNINCTTAMPNKVLVATITDSYTPSNINTNGILKNQPSLANRSNVDVQLRDDLNNPLAIGTQSPFYTVPVGSSATTFIKALKARYYRSAATATAGYVQTQATVSLDYQ
ncbi:fimbrial protein [Acinetobacter sp.]|jgi:type 1 fimbria pilin|uniref:fimbrial protein n=1 Tax=Acinetobacter sp. TaxID=472 RepID=UPI002819287E|nr:fimbrial protein [Acinetobacter sp.]MDR0235133.1 fimbrial protein [Acinetobacter sp.]